MSKSHVWIKTKMKMTATKINTYKPTIEHWDPWYAKRDKRPEMFYKIILKNERNA